MKATRKFYPVLISAGFFALSAAAPAKAAITIDTSNPSDWKISNGVLTVDWLPGDGRIFSMHWSPYPNQELIDQTNRDSHGPKGFYMDNVGPGSGTPSNNYYLDPNGSYIDWWNTYPAGPSNAFTWSQHHILFANDPGVHIYFVLDHGAGDIAGSIGQIQWVFRGDLTQFANTYSVNTGLGNLGATAVPLPAPDVSGTTDPGRQVQDATVDLHGLPLPPEYRREFYTKYDYSSYEYLHQAQGVYGSSIGAWMVVPSRESLTGGPSKQDLIFTNNLLIMEAYSNHLDNQITFNVPADAVMHRLYGPFYLHFNAPGPQHATPASLYEEALSSSHALYSLYDSDTVLQQNGYVRSTGRGSVLAFTQGAQASRLNQAWMVFSDNQTNFQYSHAGNQYWANTDPLGFTLLGKVAPGTYRLSAYVLGRWGELRLDGINVGAGAPTLVPPLKFTPENFGSSPPLWTIGTPDRSSHEFLHGEIKDPVDLDPNYFDLDTALLGNSVQDDREYWGNWNYWADFAANKGGVVYYATPVGSISATNDLSKWNYNQWQIFNPGLYAGIYNPSDDTTDGYKYICPSYAGNCATALVPDWQVHFTTSSQPTQGGYAVLSIGLAATEADLTVSLNGAPLVWHGYNLKNADAAVRSGFSGTYQWVVFQWDASQLNPPGQDNILTLNVNRTQGVMYDALRMELTNRSAAHEVTGWNDYEYLYGTTYEPADDSIPNNNK